LRTIAPTSCTSKCRISYTRDVVGSRNDRLIKKKRKIVTSVNKLAEEYAQLSDTELQAKTKEFRDRLSKGEKPDSLIPEAFATVREASSRVYDMRHFDPSILFYPSVYS
jgi:preprotein translocase subunit SecA